MEKMKMIENGDYLKMWLHLNWMVLMY